MQFQTKPIILSLLLAASSLSLHAIAATDTPEKDPARWSQADVTPQQRYQTMKKEADAAYRDALKECKSKRGAERTECNKEAKSYHQADLESAKKARSE